MKYLLNIYAAITASVLVAAAFTGRTADKAASKSIAKSMPVMLQQRDTVVKQQFSARGDSVPVATIVPVQGASYNTVDTITQNKLADDPKSRVARRALRAEKYTLMIDSLIGSQSYAFYPTTMQSIPRGMMQMIYAQFYYVYISPVDLEVHVPMERGVSQYVSMLNFDADSLRDYSAVKYLTQWNISFNAMSDNVVYEFSMAISTLTGETELVIQSPNVSMRYVGSVGQRLRETYDDMRQRRDAPAPSVATPINAVNVTTPSNTANATAATVSTTANTVNTSNTSNTSNAVNAVNAANTANVVNTANTVNATAATASTTVNTVNTSSSNNSTTVNAVGNSTAANASNAANGSAAK